METLRMVLVLFVCFYYAKGFIVKPGENVTLSTYTSNIQYESIEFLKRSKNATNHLILKFQIIEPIPKNAQISLKFDDKSITVGKPGNRDNVYSEEILDSSGNLAELHINLKNNAANGGAYVLTIQSGEDSASAEAFVLSAPILPIYSKPKRVLQEDSLQISCRVSGYPPSPAVQWLFAPIPIELSDDKTAISDASANLKPINISDETWKSAQFITNDGTLNGTLRFDSISIAQNGLFACNVSNELGTDYTFLLVGVKDRWAALWPFIGIVVEVTVLVAAILLYERRQIRKKAIAAPETTVNPDVISPASNVVDKNAKPDEVRLRNAKA